MAAKVVECNSIFTVLFLLAYQQPGIPVSQSISVHRICQKIIESYFFMKTFELLKENVKTFAAELSVS